MFGRLGGALARSSDNSESKPAARNLSRSENRRFSTILQDGDGSGSIANVVGCVWDRRSCFLQTGEAAKTALVQILMKIRYRLRIVLGFSICLVTAVPDRGQGTVRFGFE